MPDSNVATGATMAMNQSPPALAPVVSPTTMLIPTTLPASKTAGVAAIRISRAKNAITLEELNAQSGTIIGFVFDPIVEGSTKNLTSIAVTQLGSSGSPVKLTPTQLSALTLITNELQQLKDSGSVNTLGLPGPTKDREAKSTVGSWLGTIATGIDCGLAAVEGGVNPVADAACVAAYGAWMADGDSDSGDDGDSTLPSSVYDNLPDPDPETVSTGYQSTSQDGVDIPTGGGGSGEGPDDKPGLQPD